MVFRKLLFHVLGYKTLAKQKLPIEKIGNRKLQRNQFFHPFFLVLSYCPNGHVIKLRSCHSSREGDILVNIYRSCGTVGRASSFTGMTFLRNEIVPNHLPIILHFQNGNFNPDAIIAMAKYS